MVIFRPRPTKRAQDLRNNCTEAEKKLWAALRGRQVSGVKFSRQIPLGRYICDFVSRDLRLVIEVDGGQHSEDRRDAVRTAFLEASGYRVMRFWNNDVLENLEDVVDVIRRSLPTPTPPAGGRGSP